MVKVMSKDRIHKYFRAKKFKEKRKKEYLEITKELRFSPDEEQKLTCKFSKQKAFSCGCDKCKKIRGNHRSKWQYAGKPDKAIICSPKLEEEWM